MIGSSHDGEALNAARLADREVRQRGLTWLQVLAVQDAPDPDEVASPLGWRGLLEECLRRPGELTDWERAFLRSLRSFHEASPKQFATLVAIAAKVGIRRSAA